MPKVDITATDHALFASQAEAAGLTVDQWLTEAGRQRTSAGAAPGSLDEVWAAATRDLLGPATPAQLRSHLLTARLTALVEGVALISVPDAFTRDVIESRLRPSVVDALSRRLGTAVQIAVRVDPATARTSAQSSRRRTARSRPTSSGATPSFRRTIPGRPTTSGATPSPGRTLRDRPTTSGAAPSPRRTIPGRPTTSSATPSPRRTLRGRPTTSGTTPSPRRTISERPRTSGATPS